MAVDPNLLVVVPIDEIETVLGLPNNGWVLFYDGGNNMKKMSIDNFNNLTKSSKPLKPTDPTPTEEGLYMPTESGTYANAGGLIAQEGYYTLFFFDGSNWTKSENKMPESEVENVTPEQTTFLEGIYINTFDKSKSETGYLNNGNFSSNPNYLTSDFIPIKVGDVIRKVVMNVAFYDENKNLLSYNYPGTTVDFTVTEANAKFFRVDAPIGVLDSLMVVVNREFPTSYIPYERNYLDYKDPQFKTLIEETANEISSTKVREIHINLFDKSKALTGYLNNGNFSQNPNYFTSDYIAINLNDVVTGSFGNYAFYDENKALLTYHYVAGATSFTNTNVNARFFRIDNTINYLDSEMLIINQLYPPYYIPYERTQLLLESDDMWRYSFLLSKNRGLKWRTFGDSITNGVPNGWRFLVSIELGLENINDAKDGATISYVSNSARIISEYIDTVGNDGDIITVSAMVNDVSAGVPLGTFSDTTNTTFYGAYKMVAEKLLKKYTGKKIAFFTGIQRQGNTFLKPYCDVIKEVGAFYGIPVLDLNATCGLYPDLPEYMIYYDNIGLHPNAEGHKIIAPKVATFINNL